MKHLLVVTLLICLLTGIAPACASSSQSALTQNGIYDEWYTVSATMFDDIKFDPKDPNIAYAVANKELYKSYDGGDTWQLWYAIPRERPIPYGTPEHPFREIFIDPQNTQIMYAIMDGPNYYSSTQIAKSVDGGKTWKSIYSWNADINLSNPNIMYATVLPSEGCYDTSTHDCRSHLVKTTDGGQTWENKLDIETNYYITLLKSNPFDPNTVYIGVIKWYGVQMERVDRPGALYDGFDTPGIFKSTDGGNTWTQLEWNIPYTSELDILAIEPTSSDVLYVLTDKALYKSEDGGKTLEKVTSFEGKNEDPLTLAVDPKNPQVIYLTLKPIDAVSIKSFNGIRKSTDGGRTWLSLNGYIEYASAGSIYINPHDTRIIFWSNGHSNYPDGVFKMIQVLNNQPPRNLKITKDENGNMLYWDPPEATEGIKGYYVYKSSTNEDLWKQVAFVEGTRYYDKDVFTTKPFLYTVRALRSNNTLSPRSNIVNTHYGRINMVEEIMQFKIGSQFISFPNPIFEHVQGAGKHPQEIDPGRGTVPVIIQGRTLLPIRAIIEYMGGNVAWDERTQKITIEITTASIIDEDVGTVKFTDNVITLTVGNNKAIVNGKQLTLDVPPRIINDRTMVPIRFVAESLGCEVLWDEKTQTVTIKFKRAQKLKQ